MEWIVVGCWDKLLIVSLDEFTIPGDGGDEKLFEMLIASVGVGVVRSPEQFRWNIWLEFFCGCIMDHITQICCAVLVTARPTIHMVNVSDEYSGSSCGG